MTKAIILMLVFVASSLSFSQVIGGRENSETTPKIAEPTQLSGGGFVGDVNVMTGEFQASIPLGSVTTPAGLGFSLTLNHSSSFSFSQNQPMTAGIPYGDGWSPNIPTVSIETDVFRKFNCTDLQTEGGILPAVSELRYDQGTYTGKDEGDLYWFAPMVNISGVASGRAIFKYIDNDDSKCLVFVLQNFESPVELRYYGNKWTVQIADGTKYEFSTHLANYRAPSNQRVLFYDQSSLNTPSEVNINREVALGDDYSTHAQSVQNVIEPKQTYSVWYCDLIFNQNTPLQGVRFTYKKFGKFNYFQEFNQERYQGVRTDLFYTSTNTDFSAYSDVFLQKVYSYVMETPFEIVELDYATDQGLVDNTTMLDFDQTDVERKDSLYNYQVVKNWGVTDQFTSWNRAKHWAASPGFNGDVNSTNPYLSTNGSNSYIRQQGTTPNEMPFNHGFLESPRIFDGANIYPGDVYEIRTTISRPDGSDLDNGNGTWDIAVRTGTLGNNPNNETNPLIPNNGNQTSQDFDKQKGVEVFSTFNSAVKWQMGYGQSVLETSNFFVMPNIPSTYHGMNIQIGGGNSDIDYGADLSVDYSLYDSQTDKLNLLHAYPFYVNGERKVKSSATIGHNFGTGHPWGMMIPVYNKLALSNPSSTTAQPNFEELYGTWWLTAQQDANLTNHESTPTKFNEDVVLENVQLIRYSKNPYMLQGVKSYKVNGDYSQQPNGVSTGAQLVAQKRLEYEPKDETLIRNYDYQAGEPIHNEFYMRRVILLSKVREIPIDVPLIPYEHPTYNLANAADTSELLTTFFGYTKILDNGNVSYTYDQTRPYQGLNQYVLDSYVDYLGGITKVEYYPFGGNGETRSSVTYVFNPCDVNMPARDAMSKGRSYTGHVAVRYLGKNDEQDVISTETNPFNSQLIHKVWEYQYDVNSKIYNPKQMALPGTYFKSQYLYRNDVSFGKVRVISPQLTTGEYSYTDYEYYGNPDWNDHPTLDEFLYFGKLKSMKVYDHNNVLHNETITNYGKTLAFKNAYARPNPVREKLGYDDLFARSYEYEDIYKNEPLTIEYDNTLYTGSSAYLFIDAPYLNGNYFDREQPKFLEFPFYTALTAINPSYFFDSYFVKKTSEINRTYEKTLEKGGGTSNPATPPIASVPDDPFGGNIVNQITDDPITTTELMASIDTLSSMNATVVLLDASPLSDSVLIYMVNSSMRSHNIASVLAAQGGLSDETWNMVLSNQNRFSEASLDLVLSTQPYFTDAIQQHLLSTLTVKSNYNFVGDLLLKNEYLSNSLVLDLTKSDYTFPEETFGRVMQAQPALPFNTLMEVINSVHLKDANLVEALSNQIITSEHWQQILNRTEFSTETITQLVELTDAYPSDVVLELILDHNPSFKESQILRIFDRLNRRVDGPVEEKLFTNYPQIANDILFRPYYGNPLDQFCHNAVVESRKYIETKTEYEYYEADYTGKAVGIAYEMLLGHRSEIDDPTPYPYALNNANYTASFNEEKIVRNLRLKHEPSWQVYSIKTSSPQYPDAFNREEFYYLYDLQNRYDRYWYNYDLNSGDYEVHIYDLAPSLFSPDTVAVNLNWASEYSDIAHPQLPPFDGMERSRTYGNRVFAFQKSVLSKNSRDEAPLIRSEYFDYDRRWRFNDLPGQIEVVTYDGVTCPTAPPLDSLPCGNFFDCTDCYSFKYTTDELMQALVPLGHCAYSSPTLGWFICPQGTNVGAYAPDAMAQYCNLGVSSSESPVANPLIVAVPKMLPFADALSKTLLLRSVTLQVDTLNHSASQQFVNERMDRKNKRIAEFKLGNQADTDTNNFAAPYSMVYPFDHLTVRTILERNRYLQPALEENGIGLQTKYYYNKSQSIWNTNANCTNPAYAYLYNYQSTMNEDIAQPIRISVGYNKVDSLSTSYDYNSIGLVEKTTAPTGRYLEYIFDNYHRLQSVKENGNRHLSDHEYFNWNHTFNELFEERTEDNYVQATLYNSDPLNDPNGIDRETRKAFIDPLGRNHSVVTAYSLDGLNHVEIHSGTVQYDNWGRIQKAYKNFRKDSTTTTVGLPKIHLDTETGVPFGETRFENTPKARPLRTSNYDVAVTGIHAVKTSYCFTNDIYASCELDLSAKEVELIFGNSPTSQYRFMRTEVLDQDDKRSVEYLNALGQKIATLNYNNNNQKVVTLFVYDSYGNVETVINPEKQQSLYEYNILGQLVKEKTVDAGTKRFMYNKQGLVSVTLDEQGQFYNPNGGGTPGDPTTGTTEAFYRVYHYDDFGRLRKVGRSEAPAYSVNQEITPLHYKTIAIGDTANGAPENGDFSPQGRYMDYVYSNASSQDWLVAFDAWGTTLVGGMQTGQLQTITGFDNLFYPTVLEKEFIYGGNVNSNSIGQLIKSYSYDNDGMKIQRIENSYDANDNLFRQTIAFNPNANVDQSSTNLVSTITYPAYNYRNSLQEQTVDVNGDDIVDYHCFMRYDALNRLKSIYGAAGFAATINDATLLVSYQYDDANGLIDKKTHHVDDLGLSALAQEIDYSFDARDRITRIQAGIPNQPLMMDYALFYDDQVPMYTNGTNVEVVNHTTNWNGNINGTTMRYGVQSGTIANPVSNFDQPLLYGYTYDKINRMTGADATVGNWLQTGTLESESRSIGDVSVSHDRIGNIKSLHRTLKNTDVSTNAPYSEIQHWNYSYVAATNRLSTVDGQNGTLSRAYSYDANGNLLTDNYKNIIGTEYGRAAYPFSITKGQTEIDYLYSANDLRIYKKSVLWQEIPEVGMVATETVYDYYLMDGLGKTVAIFHSRENDQGLLENWEYFASGAERECRLMPTVDQAPVANVNNSTGVRFGKDQVSFYLYDHLGNTRLNYTPTSFISHPGDPTIAVNKINTVLDYFPYGKVLREFVNGDHERYLTTQHERDQETELDYRGARYYDGDIGRFLSLDPHATRYPEWSDYSYAFCNPIAFIDSDGKDPDPVAKVKSINYDSKSKQYTIVETVRTVQTALERKNVGTHNMETRTKTSTTTTFTSVISLDGAIVSSKSQSLTKIVVNTKSYPKMHGDIIEDPEQVTFEHKSGTEVGPLAQLSSDFMSTSGSGAYRFPVMDDQEFGMSISVGNEGDKTDLQSVGQTIGLSESAYKFERIHNDRLEKGDFRKSYGRNLYKEYLKQVKKI